MTGDCDFECGPCYWNVTACANFDWIVHEGATNTYGTGPSSDHTFGNKEGWNDVLLPLTLTLSRLTERKTDGQT